MINATGQQLPQKFYHLTRPFLVESMQKCGKIVQGNCIDAGDANFLLDMRNFLSSWGNFRFKNGMTLQEKLMFHAIRNSREISLVSIPTSKLDTDKLFIRSQNKVFTTFDALSEEEYETLDKLCKDVPYYKIRDVRRKFLEDKGIDCEEIFEGASLNKIDQYEKDGEAYEVFYRDDIPFEAVEDVTNLNIFDIKSTLKKENFVQGIINRLLGGK